MLPVGSDPDPDVSSDGGPSGGGVGGGSSDGRGTSDGTDFSSTLDGDCQTTNIRAKLRRALNILQWEVSTCLQNI